MGNTVDWVSIRTEYETSNISQRKLAEKRGVSYPTLRDRAKREGWARSKEETRAKIVTKTLQKTVTKIATKEADRNARHIALLDKVLDKAEQVIDGELNIHLDMFGKPHKSPIIDVGRLDALSRIIEKAQKGHRTALGIDKELDRERLALERQRLKIMEDKEGDRSNPVNVVFNIPRPQKEGGENA